MVSWIAAIASLRYCLAIVLNLRALPVLDQRSELLIRQLKDVPRRLLEGRFFLLADVGLLALGKSVDEEGAMRLAVKDQGPVASCSADVNGGKP
ncbi:hypothetical protein [Lamprobacter modestohalophilus]|uniref:hypothetical protein n=1 Tax=Lamprobacter modestohalophilus TaxID=1064514 RepID=UPI003D1889DE